MKPDAPIDGVETRTYTVPTDAPEADGTLSWDSTTMVLVKVRAGGREGIGYSYAHAATAALVESMLKPAIEGRDAMDVPGCWDSMLRAIRNQGHDGIAAMGIAAVDVALWDLKARLLDVSLGTLLGQVRDGAAVYGSGGFTSYSPDRLREQLSGSLGNGISRVKIKVGSQPDADVQRVAMARDALGAEAELYVDANGAYATKQALDFAERFADYGVSWFEEPVSSDDLAGLRLLRHRAPAGMEIAAGEYGYSTGYFRRMLAAEAVDVLQADATRCAGISGFLNAGALCHAFQTPLSSHTAPCAHLHACCAVSAFRHMEYFHDHVRIERMFFDGFPEPVNGRMVPDRGRPGLGISLREQDAERFRV